MLNNEGLAITGWGVVSPIGTGVDEFVEGFAAGKSGKKPVNGHPVETVPCAEACIIPDFDAARYLGKKGTRFLDRTTAFAVVASGMALRGSNIEVTAENQSRIGVVLGTTTGSIKSIADFTRDTLVQERPYLVNPLLFPNTVMNCAAGQAAIWHKLKGVNATVAGGRLSSLLALRYAALTIRRNYADVLVTGGVEEFCAPTAYGRHLTNSAVREGRVVLGEGCVMVILEHTGLARLAERRILAQLLACETGVYSPVNGEGDRRQADGLATCLQRALRIAGVLPRDVWAIALHGCGDPILERVEKQALNTVFSNQCLAQVIDTGHLVGECFSATGAFQLAGALAQFEKSPADGERIVLVVGTGHGGRVGCAIIKAGPS
ncbi:MAG: beta-ketoacyl synthase N-terminal-like domain-containing protein [Acidiferrobacterales bacterium]